MGPPESDTVWFANTGIITKRQNRFSLYLDPPIGAFSPKNCSAQQQSGFFVQHFYIEGNAHFQSILQFPFYNKYVNVALTFSALYTIEVFMVSQIWGP